VLYCNWWCELGEIDIVVCDGDCLVVCEVKIWRLIVCGYLVEVVMLCKVV